MRCEPRTNRAACTAQTTHDGFTLVELMVVISIIALLIALLLPALSKARKAVQLTVCGTQLKSSGIAMVMYAFDFKSVIAKTDYGRNDTDNLFQMYTHSIGTARPVGDLGRTYNHGSWLINGYLANAKGFFCPGMIVFRDDKSSSGGSPYSEKPSLYSNEYAEAFSSGGLSDQNGGPNWRPMMPTTYNFNAALIPVDGNYTPAASTQFKWHMLVNKTDPYAGRKYYEFDSTWPVLTDHRGGGMDGGITTNHDSRGYNVLRGDGSVKFISVAALVAGGQKPGITRTTNIIKNTTGTLPVNPLDDDATWNFTFFLKSYNMNGSYEYWNSFHGALR